MIFVTGASGNVGSQVVPRLAAAGTQVRALSRKRHAHDDRSAPSVEWIEGDFSRPLRWASALEGVDTVVLISPASPELVARELAVLDAARSAGVQRIVKLSGLGAGPDAPIRLPKAHYEVEQAIRASGLIGTFVRPNLFYQTLLGSVDSIVAEGVIYAPAGQGRISFTDTRDIASVITRAVLDRTLDEGVFEITGPQALTYAEVASAFSSALGMKVTHVDLSPEQQREYLRSSGLDDWTTEAFVELFQIYRAGHGASVLDQALSAVTGDTARSLQTFIRDHLANFSPKEQRKPELV